jgi:hypothetical protein
VKTANKLAVRELFLLLFPNAFYIMPAKLSGCSPNRGLFPRDFLAKSQASRETFNWKPEFRRSFNSQGEFYFKLETRKIKWHASHDAFAFAGK